MCAYTTEEMTKIIEQYLLEKMQDEHCDDKSDILRDGIKQVVQLRFHKELLDKSFADNWISHIESAVAVLNNYIERESDSVWDCYLKYKSGDMPKQELVELVNKKIDTIVGIKHVIFRLGKFDV